MKKQNVILVDDDETFHFINTKVIQLSGIDCEVHTTCSGNEALRMINELLTDPDSSLDVIFVDIDMPVMDGFQFIRILQQMDFPNKERTKIAVLTSSDSLSDKKTAMSLGIDHFITKPLTEAHVATVLSGS